MPLNCAGVVILMDEAILPKLSWATKIAVRPVIDELREMKPEDF